MIKKEKTEKKKKERKPWKWVGLVLSYSACGHMKPSQTHQAWSLSPFYIVVRILRGRSQRERNLLRTMSIVAGTYAPPVDSALTTSSRCFNRRHLGVRG